MPFLFRNGRLVYQDGKAVVSDDTTECVCCDQIGEDPCTCAGLPDAIYVYAYDRWALQYDSFRPMWTWDEFLFERQTDTTWESVELETLRCDGSNYLTWDGVGLLQGPGNSNLVCGCDLFASRQPYYGYYRIEECHPDFQSFNATNPTRPIPCPIENQNDFGYSISRTLSGLFLGFEESYLGGGTGYDGGESGAGKQYGYGPWQRTLGNVQRPAFRDPCLDYPPWLGATAYGPSAYGAGSIDFDECYSLEYLEGPSETYPQDWQYTWAFGWSQAEAPNIAKFLNLIIKGDGTLSVIFHRGVPNTTHAYGKPIMSPLNPLEIWGGTATGYDFNDSSPQTFDIEVKRHGIYVTPLPMTYTFTILQQNPTIDTPGPTSIYTGSFEA
ncbi:MAG: hypothetical protein CL489_06190 [Acidobacteria bacterium]|nr:hypothetical protein [Acidobacteriota bacterium]|tara:strand:+ start:30082 stop:31230 length:1149 start_codon:yes stop_codon:yes gene_type:complete